jgi:hypothetical protein
MFNPLMQDVAQLKDSELEARITDLNKKYSIALRVNGALAMQIAIILAELRDETSRRSSEAMNKMLQKQNKDLGKLINIG